MQWEKFYLWGKQWIILNFSDVFFGDIYKVYVTCVNYSFYAITSWL